MRIFAVEKITKTKTTDMKTIIYLALAVISALLAIDFAITTCGNVMHLNVVSALISGIFTYAFYLLAKKLFKKV